ncbi:MAG: hypothetical protein Q8930_10030 [Bacillota bacterium]|nr:hypothetical protein [Bacillota bacterium]
MRKKGAALIVVVIVMMVTLVLAAFMLDTSVKNSRLAADTRYNTRAYYSAEAGIYDFINYIKNNNCSVSTGTSIINLYNSGGLYGDNMASYKATLNSDITYVDSASSRTYSFSLYSSGSYGSQGYVITASVSMVYTKNTSGVYIFSNYIVNSKQVYKA